MKPLLALDPAAMAVFGLNVLFALTAICLIALIAVRRFFRYNPSLRYCVCLAGLIGLLLSPLVVGIQARARYGLLTLSLPENLFRASASETEVSRTLSEVPVTNAGLSEILVPQQWICRGLWGMFTAWAVGVVFGAVRLVRGYIEVSRRTGAIRTWSASAHVGALDRLEHVLGHPLPPLFTSSRVVSPVAVGLFRPVVILPEGLSETLSPAQLRQVLLHECAHVAFRHTVGGVVERIARLLFWPHPLIHALCRDLAWAREEMCDNVASQEDGAACYARTLLAIAEGRFTAPNVTSALALLGPETSLEERIAGLLDPRRNRMTHVERWKVWAVTGAAIFAVSSIVMVRVVAAEVKTKQDDAGKAILPQIGRLQAQKTEAEVKAEIAEAEAKAKAKHAVSAGQHSKPILVRTATPGTFAIVGEHGELIRFIHTYKSPDDVTTKDHTEELGEVIPDGVSTKDHTEELGNSLAHVIQDNPETAAQQIKRTPAQQAEAAEAEAREAEHKAKLAAEARAKGR